MYVSDVSNIKSLCERNNVVSKDFDLSECFIQTIDNFRLRKVLSFTNTFFRNNTATHSGSDIYGGLLDRCRINPAAEIYKIIKHNQVFTGVDYVLKTCHFDWPNTTTRSELTKYISSSPVQLCFCLNDQINCSYVHSTVYSKKGEEFRIQAASVDHIGNPVKATVITTFSSQTVISRLKEGQEYQHMDSHCSDLKFNVFSTENTAHLILYADGPCQNRGISKRNLIINFLPCLCLPGFENTSSKIECDCRCDKRLDPYVKHCSLEDHTVQIDINVWISTTEKNGFIISNCPFDYCVEKPVNISLNSSQEIDKQCAFNRSGVLCGECQQGLSLVFASARCLECTNYYLFLIIPFALMGIALVTLILVLNMTVAEGTINGLIFYANILAANRPIFLPFKSPNFLTVFISWLNLDWGIETCFYDGMNSYGKFLLQLAFPMYLFVIIGIIIAFSEQSSRFTAVISKRKPIATLCTLILLSYSKLLRTVITSLQYSTLHYPDVSAVWLFDGNVPYFRTSHIPRFIIAFVVIVLGFVYTSLLLFGQVFDHFFECLNQRSPRLGKLMKWTSHSKYVAFVREYTAPLADKHRYWVGLLLLVRIIHHLISAFAPDDAVILVVGVLTFGLVLFKHLIYSPAYKNWLIYNKLWIDILESSFFVNLIILASATFFNLTSERSQLSVAYISMTVSFLTFVVITLFHVCSLPGMNKLSKRIRSLICECCAHNQNQFVPQDNLQEDEDSNDELLPHEIDSLPPYTDNIQGDTEAQVTYHTEPLIRRAVPDDQLRESWMDDLAPVRPEDYQFPTNKPHPPHPERRVVRTSMEVDIRADHKNLIV